MPTAEEIACENMDKQLTACGGMVQSRNEMNLYAGCGVAVRELPLSTGEADYLAFVDRKAVEVAEAKPEGVTLSGVAVREWEGITPKADVDAALSGGVTMKLFYWSWSLGTISYVVLGVLRRSVTSLAEISLGNKGAAILILSILLAVGGTVLGVMSWNRNEVKVWWVIGVLVLNIVMALTGIMLSFPS